MQRRHIHAEFAALDDIAVAVDLIDSRGGVLVGIPCPVKLEQVHVVGLGAGSGRLGTQVEPDERVPGFAQPNSV